MQRAATYLILSYCSNFKNKLTYTATQVDVIKPKPI